MNTHVSIPGWRFLSAGLMFAGSVLTTPPASAGPYFDAVMAQTPAAYYRFNEGSGNVLVDSSGNGRNGTYVNTPTLGQSGRLAEGGNSAVRFTAGSGEHATIPYSFGSTGAVTIEAWFNSAGTTNDWQILLSSPAGSFVDLFFDVGNRVYSLTQTPAGSSQIGSLAALSSGWNHIVLVADSTGQKLYVNAALAASGLPGGLTPTSSLIIGADNPAGGFFLNGWLDELAIYPRVLSQATITQNYQAANLVGTTATPEPATSALLAVGIASLAGLLRRPLPSA